MLKEAVEQEKERIKTPPLPLVPPPVPPRVLAPVPGKDLYITPQEDMPA